jgi:hypothetical protein
LPLLHKTNTRKWPRPFFNRGRTVTVVQEVAIGNDDIYSVQRQLFIFCNFSL